MAKILLQNARSNIQKAVGSLQLCVGKMQPVRPGFMQ